MEKDEAVLKDTMVSLLTPYIEEFGTNSYLVNGAKVLVVHNAGRAVLSADKLREQGVDPEVIGLATSRTPYTQYNTGTGEGE